MHTANSNLIFTIQRFEWSDNFFGEHCKAFAESKVSHDSENSRDMHDWADGLQMA